MIWLRLIVTTSVLFISTVAVCSLMYEYDIPVLSPYKEVAGIESQLLTLGIDDVVIKNTSVINTGTRTGQSPIIPTIPQFKVPTISSSVFNDGHNDNDDERCRIYIAPSTIPNAGWGIFAGVNIEKDEEFATPGDAIIPWFTRPVDGLISKSPNNTIFLDFCFGFLLFS
jgi:hypothetical protein